MELIIQQSVPLRSSGFSTKIFERTDAASYKSTLSEIPTEHNQQ